MPPHSVRRDIVQRPRAAATSGDWPLSVLRADAPADVGHAPVEQNEEHKGQISPLEIFALVVHHVRPVLGWRTGLFVARRMVRLPHYRKRVRADEGQDLSEIKRSLFPLAALHHELTRELGDEARALVVSQALALDVAVRLQRRWYLTTSKERRWDAFHQEHER